MWYMFIFAWAIFLTFIYGLAVVGIWFLRKRKNSNLNFPKLKVISVSILVVIEFVCFTYIGITKFASPNDDQQKQASSQSSSSSKSSKKESSSEELTDDSEVLNKLSSKKLTEYNSGLDDLLTEDQKDYSNGKDDYAWAMFADKIQFSQKTGLTLYVTDNFQQLGSKERKLVGNGAQKLAKMQMVMMDLKTTPDNNLLSLNVHYGNDRIGHSKLLDSSKFKWSDIK